PDPAATQSSPCLWIPPRGAGGEGVEQPPQRGGGVHTPAGGGVTQLRRGTAQPGGPAGGGGPGQDLDAGVFVVAQPGTRGDQLAQGVGVVLDTQRVRLGEHGQQRPTRLPRDIQRAGRGPVVVHGDGGGRPGGAGVGGDRG